MTQEPEIMRLPLTNIVFESREDDEDKEQGPSPLIDERTQYVARKIFAKPGLTGMVEDALDIRVDCSATSDEEIVFLGTDEGHRKLKAFLDKLEDQVRKADMPIDRGTINWALFEVSPATSRDPHHAPSTARGTAQPQYKPKRT